MATTTAGARLTQAHRQFQARISRLTVERLLELWPMLEPAALDATTTTWLLAALPTVTEQRRLSALAAAKYLRRFRLAELGPDAAPFEPVALAPIDLAQVSTSLITQGPFRLRALVAAGRPLEVASRTASMTSSVAGSRHALSGGRQVITATTITDPDAHGTRRVTSPGCCAFCAMLAARDAAGLEARYFRAHDNCHCQPETAYSTGTQDATRQAKEFNALYHEAADGVGGGGNNKLNAFRRALAEQRNS